MEPARKEGEAGLPRSLNYPYKRSQQELIDLENKRMMERILKQKASLSTKKMMQEYEVKVRGTAHMGKDDNAAYLRQAIKRSEELKAKVAHLPSVMKSAQIAKDMHKRRHSVEKN